MKNTKLAIAKNTAQLATRITIAILLGIVATAALLTACATNRSPASISMHTGADEKSESWKLNMAQLADAFSLVIPHTTSDTYPESTQTRQQVIASVKVLRKLSHQINPDKTQMGADPRFASIADQLQTDLDDGVRLLEQNKWKSGIRRVAQATQNCVACHTVQLSTPTDPQEQALTVTDSAMITTADNKKIATSNNSPLNSHLAELTPLQRGDFFVATQQFDFAIDQYEAILANPNWAHAHPSEWNGIFVKLLAVTVRVKADPSLLMELVSRFIDSGTYPNSLKDMSRLWRHQAGEWRAEQRSHKKETIKTAEKLLAEAAKLSTRKAPYKGLLLYLRASRILNTRMLAARTTDSNDRVIAGKTTLTAKDYYLSGVAEEGLASAIVWTFPEAYFQKCAELKSHASAESQHWIKRCESKLANLKET